jgi:GrpB-like predicted nucleotidyltransferase (UPF0157 family)
MTDGEAPIEIVRYDRRWPALFNEERQRLQPALAPWLAGSIEHIGSTAVPGMAAKPVIDIMAGVSSLGSSRQAIEAATMLGYCYFPYRPDVEHWFCKPSPAHRTHHLHLVTVGSPHWIRRIAFREYLRAHGRVAADYETLKRELASRFRFDREAYTDAKSPFIDAITDEALAGGYGHAAL